MDIIRVSQPAKGKQGGARAGAGRPHLDGTRDGSDDPTVTITIRLTESLKEVALRLGGGSLSRGIRRALRLVAGHGHATVHITQ